MKKKLSYRDQLIELAYIYDVKEIKGYSNIVIPSSPYGEQMGPYDQLVLQGGIVIHIPKWRLDAQKILREKSLTLNRLKALNNIVSDNAIVFTSNLCSFSVNSATISG